MLLQYQMIATPFFGRKIREKILELNIQSKVRGFEKFRSNFRWRL